MGFFADTSDTVSRFSDRIDEFRRLYKSYGLDFGKPKDIWRFVTLLASDGKFRGELTDLGNSVLRREGGKISLTVLFTIIAISIGGIGIAGMGSAFGLPAAALMTILGTLGFGIGQELDTIIAPASEPIKEETIRHKTQDISEQVIITPAPTEDRRERTESTPDRHVTTILEVLQSLDATLTPMSAAIIANRSDTAGLAELVNKTHAISEETQIGLQGLIAEVERVSRAVKAQETRLSETLIVQTNAIRRQMIAIWTLAALLIALRLGSSLSR